VHAVERRHTLLPQTTLLIGEPETYSYEQLQRTIANLLHGETDWQTQQIPKAVAKTGAWIRLPVAGPRRVISCRVLGQSSAALASSPVLHLWHQRRGSPYTTKRTEPRNGALLMASASRCAAQHSDAMRGEVGRHDSESLPRGEA
jgi:hypothetical protein